MYLLLLFGTTAKEFIHMFADHHDTVHVHHEGGELSFESEHHHCDFLSYSLPAFDNDISFPFIAFFEQATCSGYIMGDVQFVQRAIVHTSLRGPPVVPA
jgi:hypothetical protein